MANNVSAVVKDGVITNQSSSTSSSSSSSTSTIDDYKDQFMQLLVAQMKYQDPLEPTSNTEYISEYATFTQVEQLSSMSDAMTLQTASNLVGKTVIVNTEDSSGNTVQIEGKVDYITYDNGDVYLNIDGNSYSADNVASVVDDTYYSQINNAYDFVTAFEELPDLAALSVSDASAVTALKAQYDGLDSETQARISSTYKTSLDQYVARIAELQAAASSSDTSET